MKNRKLAKLLSAPLGLMTVLGVVVVAIEYWALELLHDVLIPLLPFEFSHNSLHIIDGVVLSAILFIASYFLFVRKLMESEERFRQTLATAPNAIVIADEQGRITDWNASAQRIFQYSREEAAGQQMHRLIVPSRYHSDAVRGFAAFKEAGTGPLVGKTTEIAARRKDGSEFPVEISISALKMEGCWHAIGIIRDITERKQAEEYLQKSKNLLQSIMETVPIRIFWKDRDSRYLGCNTQFAHDAGYSSPDELTGKTDFDMGWKDRAGLYRADDAAVMESGTPKLDFEEQETTPDGGTIWVRTSKVPLRDEGNQIIGMLGIYQDITLRKQMEEKLRETRDYLESLFNYANAPIIVWDPSNRITMFNHAFEHLTGRLANEVTGKQIDILFPEDCKDEAMSHIHQTRSGEHWESIEIPILHSSGEIRTALWNSATLYSADGKNVVAIMAQGQDITGRKRAEMTILEAGIHLKEVLEDAIGAIAATLEQRDPYTAGHQRRVSQLAVAIGKEMGLEPEVLEGIRFGGLIHDIGKISVPAEILSKPGKLTDIEYGLVKFHAEAGYQIIKEIDFPWPVAVMVHQHHEHLDGSGYPLGLKGGEIIRESRILTVADVVEAMTANRPYRPNLSLDAAFEEIARGRGTQYDAAAVDACLRIIREKRFILTK